MNSGEQQVEFVARFSSHHPIVTVLRQVAYFSLVGLYLVMLTVLTNGILGPRIPNADAAGALSLAVSAPALLAALVFYSTRPILASRGLEWREKEFFAVYAVVMLTVLLFAAALWARPGTLSVVSVLAMILTLILPSLQRFVVGAGRSGEPLVAAVVLMIAPTAQSAAQVLVRAAQGPYALVEAKVESSRGGHPGYLNRPRHRPPHVDC